MADNQDRYKFYVMDTPFGRIRCSSLSQKASELQVQALVNQLSILYQAIDLAFVQSNCEPVTERDSLVGH